MENESETDKCRLIALALYEIRVLLSSKLGSDNEADIETRLAAHLSYAIHNDALAIVEGGDFDLNEALTKIKAIDGIVNESYSSHFIKKFNENK